MSDCGYISIPKWNTFQHYKDRQPAWIKLHLDLLGNDAWLDLRTADRCLLITIWMLVGRYGNGRLKADPVWLYRQANVGLSNAYQGLQRLSDAGFIAITASPLPKMPARAEKEGSKEPLDKEGDARANGAAENGSIALSEKELAAHISQARGWLEEDPPHLVIDTIKKAWPDQADTIIAATLTIDQLAQISPTHQAER